MGFGDTAKKIQRVTKIAEETYERMNQLVGQLQDVRDRVESTSDQIESMDRELAEQRAIVEALADQQGVDVEEVVARVNEERADESADSSGEETPVDGDEQPPGENATGGNSADAQSPDERSDGDD